MNIEDFWRIIARSREVSGGSLVAQAEALHRLLAKLPALEIAEFDALFVQHHHDLYSYDLWGAAYVLLGGCSDDGFTDVRNWIIAQGRHYFDLVRTDAEALADRLEDPEEIGEAEEFAYIAAEVHEELTGRDLFDTYAGHRSVTDFGTPTGRRWGEDEVNTLYPAIRPLHE